jgi:aspartate carbamoyltransferase catalytic subunit
MAVRREDGRFYGRDWVDVHSMTRDELLYVIHESARMKDALQNKRIPEYKLAKDLDMIAASLFYENSTRTRTSFEVAAMRLGMQVTGFSSTEGTSVKKGECLTDTVDMYDAYGVDAVVMRHPLDGAARVVADHFKEAGHRVLPCFNGGDGKHEHPTQAKLDTFTINECCGRLHDLEIGIAVDAKYGRTTHSLPVILSLFPGNRFHIFTHELLRMPPAVLKFLESKGIEYHEYFESRDQLVEMLPNLDFLYMTRIQRERLPDDDAFYKAKDLFRFTPDMMLRTKDRFGIGHPLPEDKSNPSIDPSLRSHPKFWAKRQAGNGLPTRLVEMALSLGLLGHDFEGEAFRHRPTSTEFWTEKAPGTRKESAQYDIRPINTGTVIDHIENDPYIVGRIVQLLRLRENGNIYRAGVVEPKKRPGVKKGLLMIEGRELSFDDLRVVAAMAPGAVVSDIREKNVVRKRELSLPDVIEGLPEMQCTNAGCISRPEHKEHVTPKAVRVSDSIGNYVRCYECDNLMGSHEVFMK